MTHTNKNDCTTLFLLSQCVTSVAFPTRSPSQPKGEWQFGRLQTSMPYNIYIIIYNAENKIYENNPHEDEKYVNGIEDIRTKE